MSKGQPSVLLHLFLPRVIDTRRSTLEDARFGGVEAGGTKVVCATGDASGSVRERTRIETTTPEETLRAVVDFFEDRSLEAVGVGSFGPVDDNPDSPTYGFITNTPKNGWQHTDVRGPIQEALGVPVAFDLDVNAAALGEHHGGAGRDVDAFVYLTVGTGVGGSFMQSGRSLRGLLHPEIGHLRLPRASGDDFAGNCPFHGDCLEGLAAGPAIEARWGRSPADLPDDHPAWEVEAHYLGIAVANLACTLAPERVILGGGVMHRRQLFPMIRRVVRERLGGYLDHPRFTEHLDEFVTPAALGDENGVRGALAMARQAAQYNC